MKNSALSEVGRPTTKSAAKISNTACAQGTPRFRRPFRVRLISLSKIVRLPGLAVGQIVSYVHYMSIEPQQIVVDGRGDHNRLCGRSHSGLHNLRLLSFSNFATSLRQWEAHAPSKPDRGHRHTRKDARRGLSSSCPERGGGLNQADWPSETFHSADASRPPATQAFLHSAKSGRVWRQEDCGIATRHSTRRMVIDSEHLSSCRDASEP